MAMPKYNKKQARRELEGDSAPARKSRKKSPKGECKKEGRNERKCMAYRVACRREVNKAPRVRQSCGAKFFKNWLNSLDYGARVKVYRALGMID